MEKGHFSSMVILPVLALLWACCLSAGSRLRKFHLEETQTSWNISEAHNRCMSKYTDLVTVYDKQDNKELVKLLVQSNTESAWIGGCNNAGRSLQWSDGEVVTFQKLTSEDRSYLWGAAMKADGNWESLQHNQSRNFICYDRGNDQAEYNYIPNLQNKTWFEAQKYCRKNHNDLVTIRNEAENQQVHNATNINLKPFWIGLTHDTSLSWFDGGQSNYMNFSAQPNQMYTYLNSNGSWSSSNQHDCKSALCYKSFIYVSKDKMSWEDAVKYCDHEANGPLRIESWNDQIEVQRELRRQKITKPVWVGLRKSRLFGFWIWANGLHLGPWTNWKEGQPEHQISHYCGAIEVISGFKWSDKNCRSRFRVLCEGGKKQFC